MKTLIAKSLAAAFAFGALFAAAPTASAESYYGGGGCYNYSHCDHYTDCYRGGGCYNSVTVHYQPIDRGCYHDSSCYRQQGCYREQSCYRPSGCYTTSSCQISRCR